MLEKTAEEKPSTSAFEQDNSVEKRDNLQKKEPSFDVNDDLFLSESEAEAMEQGEEEPDTYYDSDAPALKADDYFCWFFGV